MYSKQVYLDRDGDELSVTPKARFGNTIPDAIITVIQAAGTKHERHQSVVFKNEEVPQIIADLVTSLDLDPTLVYDIIDKLRTTFGEGVTPVGISCERCNRTETAKWWKCCPAHTTEQGLDVMCHECSEELHPDKPQLKEPDNADEAKEQRDPGAMRPVREGDPLRDNL